MGRGWYDHLPLLHGPEQGSELNLRRVGPDVHAVGRGDGGMDLAQNGQRRVQSGDPDLRLAAGMEVGLLGGHKSALHAEAVQQRFHDALQGEEILIGAVKSQAQGGDLVGLLRQGQRLGNEALAALKHPHGGNLPAVVEGQDRQHTGDHLGPHDGIFLAQGVQKGHSLPPGIVLGQTERVSGFGTDKGVGDDLPHALSGQHRLHRVGADAVGELSARESSPRMGVATMWS